MGNYHARPFNGLPSRKPSVGNDAKFIMAGDANLQRHGLGGEPERVAGRTTYAGRTRQSMSALALYTATTHRIPPLSRRGQRNRVGDTPGTCGVYQTRGAAALNEGGSASTPLPLIPRGPTKSTVAHNVHSLPRRERSRHAHRTTTTAERSGEGRPIHYTASYTATLVFRRETVHSGDPSGGAAPRTCTTAFCWW